MDCEKFEPLLLDELYEELDEVTSAAVKRHVAGCSRCAGILNGMRATRRAAALPMMAVPIDLEDRILAAAKDAQKSGVVVPFRSRVSRAVTVAGRWAMRPQTAMAAVFLLMIGSSAYLIRNGKSDYRSSAVSVTVEGSPAPAASVAAQTEAIDPNAAANAHGPGAPTYARPAAVAAAPMATTTPDMVAAREESNDKERGTLGISNAGVAAGAPAGDPMVQQPMSRDGKGYAASDAFSLGSAAYKARNYAEATKQYDIAAQSGDQNAELWAARSVRDGQGCAVALGRFDALAKKAAGQWIGNEASFQAAQCQIAMNQTDAARARLVALQSDPAHKQQADATLNELNNPAVAKGGADSVPASAAAHPAKRAAPARAPKAAAPMEKQKAVDSAF